MQKLLLLLSVCVALSTSEPAVSQEAVGYSDVSNKVLHDELIRLRGDMFGVNTNLQKEIKSLKIKFESDIGIVTTELKETKFKLESAKRKMTATEDDLKKVQKEQKESAKNMIDAQTKIATLSTNQTNILKNINANTKNAVKLVGGRIPQNLLPGSYATATLEDVRWQAVHLAAAAACGGSFNNSWNEVYPVTGGKSCKETCAKAGSSSCAGSVCLWAVSGKATHYKQIAWLHSGYACDFKMPTGWDEVAADGKSAAKVIYTVYCCCKY